MKGKNIQGKTGVILLNLGGPDSIGAVRPFLYNLFSDRRIIRLGPSFMQKPLAWLIAATRAGKAAGYYRLIGGKSPILDITEAQARALEEALKGHGDYKVYIGMRYWRPFTEDAVREAYRDGVDRLISLSLYPHYSVATTGSSETRLKEILENYPIIECSYVSSWYAHPLYIEALADTIKKGLEKANDPSNTAILFSAHSLPAKFIEEGDPYAEHIMETIKAVAAKIGLKKWRLGYQSKSGPVKWLEPSTEDVLKEIAKESAHDAVRDVLIVPISFVSDHVETLYEIDILYRELAGSLGLRMERTESLNTHPVFIKALKEMVLERVEKKGDN